MKTHISLIVLLLGAGWAGAADPLLASIVDVRKMTEVLGAGWAQREGIVIESREHLKKLEEGIERDAADALLGLMEPHGVTAAGEFTFVRVRFPLDSLSLRIFRFESREKAEAFRKFKYENMAAGFVYRKSRDGDTIIYDSLQIRKRILFNDRLWITCGHVGLNNVQRKVLEKCVKLEGRRPI